MSRGAHSFKQSDLTKAIKAVINAGKTVRRVEIEGKKIVLIAGDADTVSDEPANEWDSVK
jgi:hypothetical protein